MRVRIYSATGGTLLGTLRSFSNTSTRNVVGGHHQPGRLRRAEHLDHMFAISTDSSVISSFHVDDVDAR